MDEGADTNVGVHFAASQRHLVFSILDLRQHGFGEGVQVEARHTGARHKGWKAACALII